MSRSLVNKAFLPGTILGFKPLIERIVARQLDKLAEKEEADLVADFTMPLKPVSPSRMSTWSRSTRPFRTSP